MENIEDEETFQPDGGAGMDPEKRKRRSSILKQKLGNQSDCFADPVSCKASRRVSFASSNFVKPFSADSEKITIWDNTYEEEVNHTDSSKSCEEMQGSHASAPINMTSFQIWESKSVQYALPESVDQTDKENLVPIITAACSNDTDLNQTEMEFTRNYKDCYQDPIRINLVEYVRNKKATPVSVSMFDMSFTCGFPEIGQEKNYEEVAQIDKTIRTIDDMDISLADNYQEVEMEFTTISNKAQTVNNYYKDTDTTTKVTNFKPNFNETVVQSVDMEFTSNLTNVLQNDNNSIVDMEFTTLQAVENISDDIDMEFTRNLNTSSQMKKIENVPDIVPEHSVMKVTDKEEKSMFNGEAFDKIDLHRGDSISKNILEMDVNRKLNTSTGGQVPMIQNKENSMSLRVESSSNYKNKIICTADTNQQNFISIVEVDDAQNLKDAKITEVNTVFRDDHIMSSSHENFVRISPVQSKGVARKHFTRKTFQEEERTGKATNILYSQPIKSILKKNDLSCNAVTPTVSFTMSLSSMSPCAETTEQFMQATFSEPESINRLLKGKNAATKIEDSIAKKYDSDEIPVKPIIVKENANMEALVEHSKSETCWDMIQNSKSICDTTPPIIEDENLSLVGNGTPDKIKLLEDSTSGDSSNYHYTLRSKKVVATIDKYLTMTKIDYDDAESEQLCNVLCEEYSNVTRALKKCVEDFRLPVFEVADFEELFREVSEESTSSQLSEGALNNSGNYQERLLMPEIVVPMSLRDRVCEAAQRCRKYWQLAKSCEDYYCFFGCFRAVPFKVHVHPDLGKVYGVQTYNNLLDESDGLTHYAANVFTIKLKQEHLSPHLGPNFDLLTLLDYICLCTDEIEKFHLEFSKLVGKYGHSHKLVMHHDNSVTFEILNVGFIIWWKISVKLSTLNLGHIESVSATHKLQEVVDEGHIKSIAENCMTGPQFLRSFIEKVDEYVDRIGRRIMMRREARFKYGNEI